MLTPLFLRLIKIGALPATVFITGACVLVIEIVAIRILAPFYGNTIYSVSSIISVILLALSVGYFAGGKFADRYPSFIWFYGIIFISGLLVLFFHALGLLFLPYFAHIFSISSGPLISALFLFFFPAFFLGTLSPFAVKLQNEFSSGGGVGSVSGTIFFWSTLGSISGSLLTGFVLIPHIGINQIMIGTAVMLSLLGFIPLVILGARRYRYEQIATLLFLFGCTLYINHTTEQEVVYAKDGVYQKIIVEEGRYNARPVLLFEQDRGISAGMYLDSSDPKDLVFDYTKYYALYKIFNPDAATFLVIGGGAYSIPKAILSDASEATVFVSEIEPSLYDISKKYFALSDGARLKNTTADGRQLLRNSADIYDVIYSDVYYSLYSIPAHFTTQEFFELAKSRLSKDGIFVANLVGYLSHLSPSFLMSEIKTFQSVFPNNYVFAVGSTESTDTQNIIIVGYNSDTIIDIKEAVSQFQSDTFIQSLPEKLVNIQKYNLSPFLLLTDNFTPVEYLTGQLLKRSFAN